MMIRLKQLLYEMTDQELAQIGRNIESSRFRFVGQGDNGRVYKLNDEDLVFKITTSTDEIEVARKIQNKITEYSTFIPVYYVGDLRGVTSVYEDVILMANADKLPSALKRGIDRIVEKYNQYSYEQGGEVSLFDFVNAAGLKRVDPIIMNFIKALQIDINKLGIPDLDLDLDFKSSNIMIWSGKMVMVDW
jgi:hypothetical protein